MLSNPIFAVRWFRCAVSLVALICFSGVLVAQPSQNPLLSRDGGGVSPNLILDLDESGSMLYQHMPEGAFTLAGKSVTLAGDRSLTMHPLDTRTFAGTFLGRWPANRFATGTELVYQQQVRSSSVNTLYYDPKVTYLPWMKSDGTRFPNANAALAAIDPMVTPTPAAAAAAAVTFVGAGTGAAVASGNITPALPAGWAAGDLLICFTNSRDVITHGNGGWTQIYNISNTSHRSSAIYKIAAAGDTSPTITHTGGGNTVSRCYAYRGVDPTNPFDVTYANSAQSTQTNTASTSITTGALTTASANSMLLLVANQAAAFTLTAASVTTTSGLAWTADGQMTTGLLNTTGVGVGVFHSIRASAGNVGPMTVTSALAHRNVGVVLALRKFGGTAMVNAVDLTAPDSSITAQWCTTSAACANASLSYTPMLFYTLKKDASGNLLDPTVSANYDSYDLTNNLKNGAGTAAPQTHLSRTDCTAGVCSLAQERQNFANWYVYHRSRILIAQSSVAESFWNVDATKLRVGWGHIHKSAATIDGDANVSTVVAGVRDFTTARKDALFDFVRNITFNSGTPLQSALWGVGKYYENATPWADDPASPGVGTPKDCRRAYHLLVTDGQWNASIPTGQHIGNYDGGAPKDPATGLDVTGTKYSTITSTSGIQYTYVPKAPYSDSNSEYLADYASYFFNRDLRSTLANNVQATSPSQLTWQGMVNFVVGIGLKGALDPATDWEALKKGSAAGGKDWGANKVDDLWHAAVNSEGKYFAASNSTQLSNALSGALNATLQVERKEAGVATTTNILEEGNRKYVPSYKSGKWTGDIRAFELDALGAVKPGPGPTGELWSVSGKVPAWNSRPIFTWDTTTGAATTFSWSSMSVANQAALGASGSAALVDYLKGDKSNEETEANATNPYRARDSLLGDFINSNPVFVYKGTDLGYQSLTQGGSDYNNYLSNVKAKRRGTLFVGSNDGMLHAFKDAQAKRVITDPAADAALTLAQQNALDAAELATDGVEIFSYVPFAGYPNLSKLADKDYGTTTLYHQYFVDGALSETDAYVKATPTSTGPSWRNYLLGSMGSGARAVFALDVTDMSSPGPGNIKWEFSGDTDLGYVSAPIQVGVLPDNTWVAIFGNGPFSPGGKAVLFVLNLETGAAQKLVADGLTASNGLGGIGLELDGNGYIKNLFAGDLNGALWKFSYDATAPSKFVVNGGAALFNARNSSSQIQPITQAPVVYDHSQGGKLIVFGTGKLLVDADRDTTETQSMYAVWDKPSDSVARPMARDKLESRTLYKLSGTGSATFLGLSGSNIDWNSDRGWVIDLSLVVSGSELMSGERVVYPPQKFSGQSVLISAVAPAQAAAVCTAATGQGFNFIIPVETGQNPTNKMFDTNGDGNFTSSDQAAVGFATKVDGIDSVITAKTLGGKCQADEVLKAVESGDGAVLVCDKVPPAAGGSGPSVLQDRLWRRIINPPIR